MSTIGDALLDTANPDRGPGRLQQQSGGRGARFGQGGGGLRARRPVHRGAGAVPDRHRRLRRLRAAGHHAARALGHPHQLRPHRRAAEPAGRRAARRGAQQCLGVPRAGAAHGLRRALLRGRRRDPVPQRLRPRRDRFRAAAGAGLHHAEAARCALCRRQLSPRPRAAANSSARGWRRRARTACPTTCPTTSRRAARSASRSR